MKISQMKGCLMHKIKAILFDIGGTLVKTEPMHETFKRILKAKGIDLPPEKITIALEKTKKELDIKKMPELRQDFWLKFNLIALENLGIKYDILSLAKAIDKEWWDYAKISLYPEALTVLHKLKEKHLKIGIVTNSFQIDMEKGLSKLNLRGLFDVEVNIDSAGKAKPAKEIFMFAVRKLCLQLSEVLFVGDEIETDYKGALNAGLQAMLIDRENKANKHIKKMRNLQEILLLDV